MHDEISMSVALQNDEEPFNALPFLDCRPRLLPGRTCSFADLAAFGRYSGPRGHHNHRRI